MFDATTQVITKSRVTRYCILRDGEAITFAMFLELLQTLPDFRQYFTSLLALSPFKAFRWETPALAKSTQDDPFEFVLLNSPSLDRPPDATSFRNHFLESDQRNHVLSFPNLGRNAQMIVPCPSENKECYTHLASYLRGAPEDQIDKLWQLVGQETTNVIQRKPRWLSTAGGGVAWLHIRLDTKPKYYGFTDYKTLKNKSRGWFGGLNR